MLNWTPKIKDWNTFHIELSHKNLELTQLNSGTVIWPNFSHFVAELLCRIKHLSSDTVIMTEFHLFTYIYS
jgi:hypothetical protein